MIPGRTWVTGGFGILLVASLLFRSALRLPAVLRPWLVVILLLVIVAFAVFALFDRQERRLLRELEGPGQDNQD